MKAHSLVGLLCGLLVPLTAAPGLPAAQAALARDVEADESISVRLASGRIFTAKIDPCSDATQLWLRWQHGSAVVRRPIQWDRVVQVQVADEAISGEQFRRIVAAVMREMPARPEVAAAQEKIVIRPTTGSVATASGTSREVRSAPRVRALAIDAVVANWDADVEVDGLLIHVYPLDATGTVVPARGMLEVDLTAERLGLVRRPNPFVGLGRWMRRVRPEDFGGYGAVYRLPFQSVHPEFDPAIVSHGVVHARLSVPGQGTFDATEGTVRIRPLSPIRNQLQQVTGSRFLPQEHTGRGRR